MSLNKESKEESLSVKNAKIFQSFFTGLNAELVIEQFDELCGFKDDPFVPDPYVHAYNAGRKSVSVKFHKLLDTKFE